MKNWIKENKVVSFIAVYFVLFISASIYYAQTHNTWPMYVLISIFMIGIAIWLKQVFKKKQ